MTKHRLDVDHVLTVEWWEELRDREPITEPGTTGYRTVYKGRRKMRGKVHVFIPVGQLAETMGRLAHQSKGDRCVDGGIVVKREGTAEVIETEPAPARS